MVFEEALQAIEKGRKLKRPDWGYPKHAYIQLDTFYNEHCFIMIGGKEVDSTYKSLYHLTYTDIKANNWMCID